MMFILDADGYDFYDFAVIFILKISVQNQVLHRIQKVQECDETKDL